MLLAHRMVSVGRRKIVEYLVRWQGNQAESWTPRDYLLPSNAALLAAYDASMASTSSPVPDLVQQPRTAPKPRSSTPAPALAPLEANVGSYALRNQPRKRVRFANEG